MQNLRGFQSQSITFDFPVTALIGANGSGKSTIFGAAGLVYREIPPSLFFPKSGILDDSMQGWAIEYDLIDKRIKKKDLVQRRIYFRNLKWSRGDDIPYRNDVYYSGIARTVPASEISELKEYRSARYNFDSIKREQLEDKVSDEAGKILGRDVSKHTRINIDRRTRRFFLTGRTNEGTEYSEFHFGAGEASIIRMVTDIELMPENSLILLEEIENGLHPVATTRLVEYLIAVAKRKNVQVIFTTHSNHALKPLPSKAIWATVNHQVFQGKLDINILRTITSDIDTKLVIYVEDRFAETWVRGILQMTGNIARDLIEIYPMSESFEYGNDSTAVTLNKHHNADPSRRVPSICIIDGDSQQKTNSLEYVFRLPGKQPEQFIYDSVVDKLSEYGGKLTIAMRKLYEESEYVMSAIRDVQQINRDPHLLFSQLGERLGFIPKSTIEEAFIHIWIQAYPEIVKETIEPFINSLPTENSSV